MIGVLQLAALVYGLHTVFIVRPVAMIFEVDRMRLVVADDVAVDELPKALPAYRSLPLTGPLLLGARAPRDAAERNDALFQGLAGKDIARPADVLAALRGVEGQGPRAVATDRGSSSSTTPSRPTRSGSNSRR